MHGFPALGFSWRHQIRPLAAAGYRLLVPDLRGYGDSDAPAAAQEYAIDVLAGDVLGLLDHAGAARGTVIGHDWGADLAWKTAWLHPGRVRAVGGLSVPFAPRAPAPPLGRTVPDWGAGSRPSVAPAAVMDGWVTDLRVSEVIPGAGHWLQQDAPKLVTDQLLRWLASVH